MIYNIKSIPTTYAGVNFRSRLEARWAAFFDLCGWKWDYEPFDLDGWAPDFLLRTKLGVVLVEVKPTDLYTLMRDAVENGPKPLRLPEYGKASRYQAEHHVLLLGTAPLSGGDFLPVGIVLDAPTGATYTSDEMYDELTLSDRYDEKTGEFFDVDGMWREAGNAVQWLPDNDGYDAAMRRIFRRSA